MGKVKNHFHDEICAMAENHERFDVEAAEVEHRLKQAVTDALQMGFALHQIENWFNSEFTRYVDGMNKRADITKEEMEDEFRDMLKHDALSDIPF